MAAHKISLLYEGTRILNRHELDSIAVNDPPKPCGFKLQKWG